MNSYDAKMVPGTKVRLSGSFLQSTGQLLGSAGTSLWVVQECSCGSCKSGLTVATDEPHPEEDLAWFTPEELRENPALRWKHIARSNLTILGQPSVRDCP